MVTFKMAVLGHLRGPYLALVRLSLAFIFVLLTKLTWMEKTPALQQQQKHYPTFITTTTTKAPRQWGCALPQIPLWHPTAREHNRSISKDCLKESRQSPKLSQPAFDIRQGHWLQRKVDLGFSCCYRSFTRQAKKNIYSKECRKIIGNTTEIPLAIDFVEVMCHEQNGNVAYREAFPLAQSQKAANISRPPTTSSSPLNVAIFGLDSTSRLNFIRKMPQSSDFLLRELGAIPLEGLTTLGHGTFKNLFPLLTGQSFADVRNGCGSGDSLDLCPFIWKDFSKMGYVTALTDDSLTNIMNSMWKKEAFVQSPTTYYTNPFREHFGDSPSAFCMGPRIRLQALLNFLESVTQVSRSLRKPHFLLSWSDLSHSNMNRLNIGDQPLLKFLQNFKKSSAWNDTVLAVIGDHGLSADMRFWRSEHGSVEYTLPLGYLVLPPWFSSKYPDKFAKLKGNIRKVVTAYDFHATLKDILQMSIGANTTDNANKSHRGVSLFEKIPDRNCLDAGISLKVCRRCFPKIPLNQNDPLVKIATLALLSEINAQVKPYKSKCSHQTLQKSQASFKWDPRDVSRELCNVYGYTDVGIDYSDTSVKLFNISCNTETEVVDLVDVEVTTKPNLGATYAGQVMVRRNRGNGQILRTFLTDNVHRMDAYKYTGHCVPTAAKPYCICIL